MAEIQVHEVEFLSATSAKIDGEPVVVITLRPDLPASFRPHNISIARFQAERLLEDLKKLLCRPTAFLLMLALVGLTGCSGQVEVETETTFSRPETVAEPDVLTTEKTRTAVSVDLFEDQGPVLMEDGMPVDMPLDGTLVVDGRIHLHEHLHIYLAEGDRKSERTAIEIVRQWNGGDCGRHGRD